MSLQDALKIVEKVVEQWIFMPRSQSALTTVVDAARLVADLPTPEDISEWVNSQPGVRADWFNPFHAQAALLAVGMGDKDWVVDWMTEPTRREKEWAAGSDGEPND